MTALVIEAIYEDGVLKPDRPLPLKEHEKVTISIRPPSSVARQTAGLIPWTGDLETLERLAGDSDFGLLQSTQSCRLFCPGDPAA